MRRRSEDSAADTLRITFLVEREIAKANLPARGMVVLGYLAQQPDGEAGFADLRKDSGLGASSITRICDALIEQGLMVRINPPEDRRKSILKLTPRGRTVIGGLIQRISNATHSSD